MMVKTCREVALITHDKYMGDKTTLSSEEIQLFTGTNSNGGCCDDQLVFFQGNHL